MTQTFVISIWANFTGSELFSTVSCWGQTDPTTALITHQINRVSSAVLGLAQFRLSLN